MKVVSIINYKGGVGKTTLTANLAGELAYRGHNVLLIDIDPQCSLTFSFISPNKWETSYQGGKTIKNFFEGVIDSSLLVRLSDLRIRPSKVNNHLGNQNRSVGVIDLIPSHLELIDIDAELSALARGSSSHQIVKSQLKLHNVLREGIAASCNRGYNFVLIDCPPNFNTATKTAIIASDYILVPAKPDQLSTRGIKYLKRNVNKLVEEFNDAVETVGNNTLTVEPKILGIIFTMIQISSGTPIRSQQRFIQQTKESGIPVMDSYIRANNSLFADAPGRGIPVVLSSYSNSTYSEIVGEIEEFVNEFIQMI